MRRSQLAKHRRRGGGVRRRDDGAERDRGRPRHLGHQHACDHSDSNGRQADGEDNEACNGRPVVFEIPRRRVVSGIEQHGGEKERQCEFREDRERGPARQKREERAAKRQEYRIRCADAARQRGQDHGCEHQADESFEFPHLNDRGTILVWSGARGVSE
jgi:hypothetical protein